MKFLCVECDQAMSLQETTGPDEGSLSVLFQCGSCGRRIAMLTNAMETQMVHSLGVKVGGRTEKARPMETLSSTLSGYQAHSASDDESSRTEAESHASPHGSGHEPKTDSADAGCPFSGMVAEQIESTEGITWTPEAEERMSRIPGFVRPMVRKGIEDHARADNVSLIDADMLEKVRGKMDVETS